MISFDNAASVIGIPSGGHVTFSFTCAPGAYLFVSGNQNITSVTCNGVSMSILLNVTSPFIDGNQQTVKVFGFATPVSGSNSIDVSTTSDTSIFLASYTGVDKNTVPVSVSYSFPNNGMNNTQVTGLAESLISPSDGAWTVYFNTNSRGTVTMTASQGTLRAANTADTRIQGGAIVDSNGPVNGGVNSTLQADLSSGTAFMGAAIFSLAAAIDDSIPQMTII